MTLWSENGIPLNCWPDHIYKSLIGCTLWSSSPGHIPYPHSRQWCFLSECHLCCQRPPVAHTTLEQREDKQQIVDITVNIVMMWCEVSYCRKCYTFPYNGTDNASVGRFRTSFWRLMTSKMRYCLKGQRSSKWTDCFSLTAWQVSANVSWSDN